jgi:alpha-amylase
MCTKFFSDGAVHSYFNPYDTPYEAFINYMNVLSDFSLRVHAAVPQTSVEQEISNLTGIIEEKEETIRRYEEEIYELNKQLLLSGQASAPAKKTTKAAESKNIPARKAPARKPATKKTSEKKSVSGKTTTAKKPAGRKTAVHQKKESPSSQKKGQ